MNRVGLVTVFAVMCSCGCLLLAQPPDFVDYACAEMCGDSYDYQCLGWYYAEDEPSGCESDCEQLKDNVLACIGNCTSDCECILACVPQP